MFVNARVWTKNLEIPTHKYILRELYARRKKNVRKHEYFVQFLAFYSAQ